MYEVESEKDEKDEEGVCGQNLRDYFSEFCSNTGIHGIKYIGEQRRMTPEKVWWFLSLGAALYMCVSLILTTYNKWQNSPVIVTFATTETPIWQIPFPTVTICPETKSIPQLFNYTDFLYRKQDGQVLSETDELKMFYLSFLCLKHEELTYNTEKFIDEKIFDFLEEVSPKFLEHISECYFMGNSYNCSEVFTPIITDEGLCYTFNLLDRKDLFTEKVVHYKNYQSFPQKRSEWSLEHGYSEDAGKDVYPKRALYAGALFDFEIKLKTQEDELDFTCGSSIQGFKIQIHNPAMLSGVKQQHFRIPLDQAVIAAMMPTIVTTSEAVKSYGPEKRKCYFPSERNLKYFKIYTQQNCQIECKTNYTLETCGCVNFYMPRENGTKICGAPMKACVLKSEDDLLEEGIEAQILQFQNIKTDLAKNIAHETVKNCNCLPECTSMTYIIENSQSDWDWVSKYRFDRNSVSLNKSITHMSYLQVFFKGNQFITSERNELYGLTDFLANSGGLLGLFTGFSILSLIEILYYLTLRICCNLKLYGMNNWSGKKDQ